MTVTGKDKIEIIEKDPEGEEGRIKVNLSFLQMCHYLQIVELIVELGPEEQEDWTFGSLVYEEEQKVRKKIYWKNFLKKFLLRKHIY